MMKGRVGIKSIIVRYGAAITGLSPETLAQWRSQRRGIPFVKIGRNVVRYRQSDLDAFLNERIVRVERSL